MSVLSVSRNETELNDIIQLIDNIKFKIKEKIKSLPDNENIKRINKNCFIIQKSEVDKYNNLSPYYYDFEYQYRALLDKIDVIPYEKLIITLKRIKTEGKITKTMNNRYGRPFDASVTLHPTVIKFIKKIF